MFVALFAFILFFFSEKRILSFCARRAIFSEGTFLIFVENRKRSVSEREQKRFFIRFLCDRRIKIFSSLYRRRRRRRRRSIKRAIRL
jgi:hypothetical protein